MKIVTELWRRREFLAQAAAGAFVLGTASGTARASAPLDTPNQQPNKGTVPMKVKTAFPLLQVESPAKAAAFYVDHFGFEPIFEADWYVQVRNGTQELAFIAEGHDSIPAERHGKSHNVCLTLEVEGVDAFYEQVKDHMDMKTDLGTEEWGQRHFLGIDPSGIMLDVMTMLPQEN